MYKIKGDLVMERRGSLKYNSKKYYPICYNTISENAIYYRLFGNCYWMNSFILETRRSYNRSNKISNKCKIRFRTLKSRSYIEMRMSFI
jgi:hypothetical protein